MPKRGDKKPFAGDGAGADPDGFGVWARRFLEHLRVRNYSERTQITTESALRQFAEWCVNRDLAGPAQVTRPVLELYQRWLFHYRKPSGKPLGFESQRQRLQPLRGFFRWLTRQGALPSNPACDLELPRAARRLPRAVLTEREVNKVLCLPDVTNAIGLRDRAILEVFYSTGIRRHELAGLELFDVEPERGVVTVRLGKGKRDRVVPIGERALSWVARYLDAGRPALVVDDAERALFLGEAGGRLVLGSLTNRMRRYVEAARLGKIGACHIFRHTMATLMLEGGADVRVIQEILGHVDASSTAIYTRVSIRHLKAVHEATHPGAKIAKTAATAPATNATSADATSSPEATAEARAVLFSSLAAERREDDDEGVGERGAAE